MDVFHDRINIRVLSNLTPLLWELVAKERRKVCKEIFLVMPANLARRLMFLKIRPLVNFLPCRVKNK